MTSQDIARRGQTSPRLVGRTAFALLAATLVSGCVAPGNGDVASSAGGELAGVATPAETAETVAAIRKGPKPSSSDVKIAAREARQERDSGTISGSAAIDRMIETHARENDIPPALAYAVVRVESRYNPKARGGSALGLSQIKPATARSLGFSGPASRLYDADTNLTYGMKYLKGAWEKSGHDVCGTAMKYKGGHRTTRMTSAALRYCSAVKAHMAEIVKQRQAPVSSPLEQRSLAPEILTASVAPASSEAASKEVMARGDRQSIAAGTVTAVVSREPAVVPVPGERPDGRTARLEPVRHQVATPVDAERVDSRLLAAFDTGETQSFPALAYGE